MATYNRTVAIGVDPVYAAPFNDFVRAMTNRETVSIRRLFFSTLFSEFMPIAPRRFFAPPKSAWRLTLDIERSLHSFIEEQIDVSFVVFAYNAVDHFIMYPEFRLCVLELVADRFEAYYAASQLRRRSPDPFDLEALLREHFVHHNVTLIRP